MPIAIAPYVLARLVSSAGAGIERELASAGLAFRCGRRAVPRPRTGLSAVHSADPEGGPVWAPPVAAAAARTLCTDCGISRSAEPKRCGQACQFIKPDYPALESRVHGRARDPGRADEMYFGPFRRMLRASLVPPRPGAQWTGIATRLGERLLETGAVDAVLTMAPDPEDRWRPVPVLVTGAAGMAQCRGMRMGYAPLLALLEPARAKGYRRLAVIGIPARSMRCARSSRNWAWSGSMSSARPARTTPQPSVSTSSWRCWPRIRTPSPIWSSGPTIMSSCASPTAG